MSGYPDRCEALGASASSVVGNIQRAGFALRFRIACFSFLMGLVMVGLVVAVVFEQRNAALERARGNAANLSAAFEEQVRRVMDNVSGAMDVLAHRIEVDGSDFSLSDWAKQVPELAASTVQVAIIGPDGRLATTTLDPNAAHIDLSDREHFRVHTGPGDIGLFIGKPVRGQVSGMVTIQVTKKLRKPDGSFGGVLCFSLDPEYLTGLHRRVDLGDTGSISLIGRSDAVVRARFTTGEDNGPSAVGRTLPNSRAVIGARYAEEGNFTAASQVDGVTRIFNWRSVSGYPLLVMVGLGKAEALADANSHGRLMIAIGMAAIALKLVMVMLLNRQIARRVDHEVALHLESEKLRTANESLIAQHKALLVTSAALASERLKLQQANADLEFAKAKAEDASNAKSSFLANMSHELRTPLNAIIGFSEIIRDRIFGADLMRYSECAADIQVSGVHLLNIINGVLDVAKIESGKFALTENVHPLADMISSCLPLVTPQAVSGSITVLVDAPKDATAVLCDETRFKQIVVNLMSNAIKFTPPGGTVTLKVVHDDYGGVNVAVSDTGIGMSRAEIGSALELFGQVDNRLARRFQGTGLGLPLAVQFAELHGARLGIESEPGKGTVVTVYFPATRVFRSAPTCQAAQEASDRRRAARQPVTHVVFLHSDRQRFRTRTVDLSETGMRLERVANFSQGDRISIDMDGRITQGVVVWQNHSHIGVKFIERARMPVPLHPLTHAA